MTFLRNLWLIVVNTYRLVYLTVPLKRFDLNKHGGRSKNTSEYFSNGWLARRHLWCCCHGNTGGRLFHVGHSLLQVGTLMWMRTTMNYQYRHGTTTAVALRTLWKQGGVRRLYRGVGPALLQGPLARFGDTAANEFVLRYLEHSAGWQKLRGMGARVAPAEKFGLGRKFEARTYAILSRIKICRDLRTFWRSLGKKKCLLHGIYCIFH